MSSTIDLERTAELLTRLREVWEQLYFTLKLESYIGCLKQSLVSIMESKTTPR